MSVIVKNCINQVNHTSNLHLNNKTILKQLKSLRIIYSQFFNMSKKYFFLRVKHYYYYYYYDYDYYYYYYHYHYYYYYYYYYHYY